MLRFEHGGVPIMWGRGIRGGLIRGGDRAVLDREGDERRVNNGVGNCPGKDWGGKKCGRPFR
jgi:hypothetical protein